MEHWAAAPAVYDFSTAQTQAYKDVSIATIGNGSERQCIFDVGWKCEPGSFCSCYLSAIPPIPSDAAANFNPFEWQSYGTGTVYSTGDVNMDGRTRATSSAIPPIPSDAAAILSLPLGEIIMQPEKNINKLTINMYNYEKSVSDTTGFHQQCD